jgi:Raf kinase inhibitor-like YbhB/YbcL family protein
MKTLSCAIACAALLGSIGNVCAEGLFIVQSPAFADNGMLNSQYAGNDAKNANCTGKNNSPPLVWSNVPPQTQSLALIVHDPEGNKGLGVTHLVAYNISPAATGFGPDALRDAKGYTGGKNTPGSANWYGPCPPHGTGAHHYTFTLIATDLPPTLPAGLTREALFEKLKGHQLAAAGLIGRFGQ